MFRFTIRDVLWLTVVVGIGLAWFRQSQRWSRATEAMRLGHEQAIADSPFPKHDFSREPTGEAADHFRLWLEDQTIDMLRRTIGDAEGIKTAIFLFVNRAYEAKMPDREIGGMFGKCFVRAGRLQEDEDKAWELLEYLGEIAKAIHSRN